MFIYIYEQYKYIYVLIIQVFSRKLYLSVYLYIYIIHMVNIYNIFKCHVLPKGFGITKDFPKERYNTYAKSCNSNLYITYPGATYSGLLLGTMRCL